MAQDVRQIRVFVSSPADARFERRRLDRVIERLNGEFQGVARLTSIRWETEFYKAHDSFQAQIPEAAQCDLVVAVFRARLGTELPTSFPTMPDGMPYPSGTAYEVLSAIEASKGRGLPDVYVFRYPQPPSVQLDDPKRVEIEAQWDNLKTFFEDWFKTSEGQFKAAFQTFASTDDFEAQVEILLRKWLEEKVLHGRSVAWPVEIKGSPFRGLAAFGAKHSPVFFGRGRDTSKAIDRLKDAAEKGCPFLLVVGASGAGKSSLVRAGLVPRLTAAGVVPSIDLWRVAVMRPGELADHPFDSLARALLARSDNLSDEEQGRPSALPELGLSDFKTPRDLAAQLAHGDETALKPIVGALTAVGHTTRTNDGFDRDVTAALLLVVDQLDELFASGISEDTRSRFTKLLELLARSGRVWIIVTLRADLFERFLGQLELKQLKDAGASFDLAPPDAAELAEIVRGPAKAADLVYETDAETGERLDERLLKDAELADLLPLLQFTLNQLFEARESAGREIRLSFSAYRALGGLEGAVDKEAEAALGALRGEERAQLPRLLRELAVPARGESVSTARSGYDIRSMALSDVAHDETSTKLVRALVDARILLSSGEGRLATVRLAHARVLDSWQRAKTIVRDNEDFYRIREDVSEAEQRWRSQHRRSDLLLARGLPLAEAQSLQATYAAELSPDVLTFINTSTRKEQLRQRRGYALAGVFGLAAFAALGAGIFAWREQHIAEDQSVIAKTEATHAEQNLQQSEKERQRAEKNLVEAQRQRSRALLTQSRFLADLANQWTEHDNAGTAMLLAIEALPDARAEVDRPYAPEAELALFSGRLALHEAIVLKGHNDAVISAAFSPDGQHVVTASDDQTARIWDAKTGNQFVVLAGHTDQLTSAIFSPDGRHVVTASADKTARIWDAETGKQIAVLAGHADTVTSATFSPDGQHVVTASADKTARVWDAETGRQIVVLGGDTDSVTSATFSPDGRRVLTASSDDTARLWDAETGKVIAIRKGDHDDLVSVVFSPEGPRVVRAPGDGTARIWDAETGKQIAILKGHDDIVTSAAFSRRFVVTTSQDNTARLWYTGTWAASDVLRGHEHVVRSAMFSPDGGRVLTSDDEKQRVWDTPGGFGRGFRSSKLIAVLAGHTDKVTSSTFSPDGQRVVTASLDKTARLWEVATHNETALDLPSGIVGTDIVATSPDGRRVVTASEDNTAQIWNAETGKQVALLAGHMDKVWSAAFSPDGRRIVTASADNTARIWDAETGKQLAVLAGHTDKVSSAAFSPDGRRVVTASLDNTALVWDAETGNKLAVLAGHTDKVWSAAFSPDGRRVVTASEDNTARIWDAEMGKQLAVLAGHTDTVTSATFSPDGHLVVTASADKTARIWDAETGTQLAVLAGHTDKVSSAAFSPNGRRVVTASSDNTARVWDAETGKTIAILKGPAYRATFSPDGRHVVTSDVGASHATRWRIFPTTQDLIDEAKQALPRCLTRDEREKLYLDAEPPVWCIEMAKWPYDTDLWKSWLSQKKTGQNPPLPDASSQ